MQGKTKELRSFDLACIAHNLKRIWTIKSQTKAIEVNSTKNGRIDQSSLKNMRRSIKGVWSQILSPFSKGLSIYQRYRYAVLITVGIASEVEMKEIYSVAKKCLNEGI
uniref:Uncharacterized protein n=1 Tax=Uncultured archaeon GZfos26G2 TaxID=3386331 RepID=Q649V3_UNCAG|nr:hypothetical protein GZ34A6_36 [uncultured archaeon GZfos34A6]